MLVLYHSRGSVASAKVRIVLEEKWIDWRGEVLDLHRGDQHRAEYLAINPRAVVPTLVHEGRVVPESTVIMEYLEEAFPTTSPLMPTDPVRRAGTRLWLKKTDELHASCAAITFALAFRRFLSRMPAADLEAMLERIPDPAMRDARRSAIASGLATREARAAVRRYDDYLVEMDRTLQHHAWLAGDAYSLADAAATPYVYRLQMVGLAELIRRKAAVAAWFERIVVRESFERAVSGVLTNPDRDRLLVAPEESWPEVSAILDSR